MRKKLGQNVIAAVESEIEAVLRQLGEKEFAALNHSELETPSHLLSHISLAKEQGDEGSALIFFDQLQTLLANDASVYWVEPEERGKLLSTMAALFEELHGAVHLPPAPRDAAAATERDKKPINSTKYDDLAEEYVEYYDGCVLRPEKQSSIDWYSKKIVAGKDRYKSLGDKLNGIPWYFIGILHGLEASFSFQTHLHNGDSLKHRTVNEPKGRPKKGNPPFTWEESAEDALTMKGYEQQSDWSLPRMLYRFERYNGFGYRPRYNPTPYLWSYSTHYVKGKYTSDGHYDPDAVSKQCGAAVSLKDLEKKGIIEVEK